MHVNETPDGCSATTGSIAGQLGQAAPGEYLTDCRRGSRRAAPAIRLGRGDTHLPIDSDCRTGLSRTQRRFPARPDPGDVHTAAILIVLNHARRSCAAFRSIWPLLIEYRPYAGTLARYLSISILTSPRRSTMLTDVPSATRRAISDTSPSPTLRPSILIQPSHSGMTGESMTNLCSSASTSMPRIA